MSTIVGVLAAAAGIAIAMVFAWWGARKAKSMIMSAFTKGKLSI